MELNTVTLSDFCKLANVIWIRGFASVDPAMQNSGLLKVMNISEHTGNTREFSEIDTNEYLSYKAEGDQAARGKVQQGLRICIALVKSLLINGENLKSVIRRFMATLNKALSQLQRLNEETLYSEAIVRTA